MRLLGLAPLQASLLFLYLQGHPKRRQRMGFWAKALQAQKRLDKEQARRGLGSLRSKERGRGKGRGANTRFPRCTEQGPDMARQLAVGRAHQKRSGQGPKRSSTMGQRAVRMSWPGPGDRWPPSLSGIASPCLHSPFPRGPSSRTQNLNGHDRPLPLWASCLVPSWWPAAPPAFTALPSKGLSTLGSSWGPSSSPYIPARAIARNCQHRKDGVFCSLAGPSSPRAQCKEPEILAT